MSFETVTIPTPERRRVKAGDLFPWLGPAEQDVRDFNQFYGEAPGVLLDGITSELRAKMKRKKLVLTHFGNVMHGWRGYVGLGKMIDAPGINGLTATSDYGVRWPGYPGRIRLDARQRPAQRQGVLSRVRLPRLHQPEKGTRGLGFRGGACQGCGRSSGDVPA